MFLLFSQLSSPLLPLSLLRSLPLSLWIPLFFHCFIRCLQCSCCFVNFRARLFCVFCPRFWFHHIEFNVNLMLNGFLVAFAVGDRRVRCYVFHTPNHQQARTQEAHHH